MDKTHYADYDTLARIAELEAENARLKAERDELDHEFGGEHRLYLTCKQELLAAQLRINELREALKSVKADLVLRAEIDSETSVAILNIGNGVLRQMNEALAAPDATPELDALMRDAELWRRRVEMEAP